MSKKVPIKHREVTLNLPNGRKYTILVDPRINQSTAMSVLEINNGGDLMKQWFKMKFYDDLSDIRPEQHSYYKHYVHHFITNFFSAEMVSGKKILDLGCGPGFYSAILARQGAWVIGIDMSPFLIDKANKHKARLGITNVEFIQADFLAFAQHSNSCEFDYVIAIDTMVSFDYRREKHDHDRVARTFASIRRILKDDGKFFIIESHPFFGRALMEIPSDTGEHYCLRSPHYKIEYKLKSDVHHWFTLDEMTKATSESGLAIARIYEPDPSPDLKQENAREYFFRLKYPGMIVYEICKIGYNPTKSASRIRKNDFSLSLF